MRTGGIQRVVAVLAAAWATAAAGAEPERFIEGTVAQASRFPDPKKSTYADCLYTVRLTPPPGSAEGPVLLALPAFMKRVAAPESRLKAGQKVEFGIVEGRKGEQALSVELVEVPPSLSKASRKKPEVLAVMFEDLI